MSAVDDARRLVDSAQAVAVLTGAGISTDSGIPDFRGPNGVWTKNPAAEKSATLQNYLADPEVRKQAWRNRLDSAAWTAQPNAGHRALVELERRGKLHTLITQNIDGLHQAAGSDAESVVEVHGTMREVGCLNCGERAPMERAIARVRAERAARECDLLLAVGSTLTVYPICDVVPIAKRLGAAVVIVNAEATQFDDLADAVVRGSISDVLPEIIG